MAHGPSNQDIARELKISDPTVSTPVSTIMGKLRLATRIQAARYALRERIRLDEEGGAARRSCGEVDWCFTPTIGVDRIQQTPRPTTREGVFLFN